MTEPTKPDLPQSGGSWVRQPDGSLTPATDPAADPVPEAVPEAVTEKPTSRGKVAAPAPEKE